MKVIITREIPSIAEDLLKAEGYEVKIIAKNRSAEKEEIIRRGKKADALLTLLSDKIDREMIDNLKQCKIIANYAVGYNNIDVGYAKSKGIIVTNTPDILTDATADIAIALTLAVSRRITEGDTFMRSGKFNGWEPKLLLGVSLTGKTFGIVGAGRIGQATAKRAKAFGMKIVYFNRSKKEKFEKEFGAKKVSLKKLFSTSDVISVHLPLTENTFHLLNKEILSLMKPNAIFVNTARGEIVEEKYLSKLLKEKKIFGAGLDVYEGEPDYDKEILKLKNVVLLPHIGSGNVETRNKMAELAAKNIIRVLKGKKPLTPVM
ncbi:MAG: D-glycerate dehydrogenase [Chlorobi bacterium]|nr:D-glycerate dehydrogenase [Chlorobiota bacterium]